MGALLQDDDRVRIELAVHGMGGFPVGDGVEDDGKVIVRGIQLRSRNQELQPVVADGQLPSLQLDPSCSF